MRSRFPRLEKISWKLTLLYSVIFSCVLLVLSAGVLYGVRYFLFDQAYGTVRATSEEVRSAIADIDTSKQALTDADLLNDAQADSDINIIIADATGKIVNQADNYPIPGNDVTQRLGVIRRPKGLRLMILNTSVEIGGKTAAYVQVAYNLGKDYRFINLLFTLVGSSDVFGILVSVLAGYLVSRRMLRPIDKITKTAKSISIRDLGHRIPAGGADDEIKRLAVTFNDMLDRLKDSIDRQSRFVSDASHELRTPISVILGYANLLDRWGKDDPKVLQESVDAIRSEAMDMRELTEKLLYLARSEGGMLAPNRQAFSLPALLEEIGEESRMIAPQIGFSAQAEPDLELFADRRMVKQLLRNLVDNSIKFSQPGGCVAVRASSTRDGGVELVVQDNGAGIPQEEVAHVFDRFYRVDRARSKESGGSGLGLSIVKSIVDSHGGDVRMESAQGKGTKVTVALPGK